MRSELSRNPFKLNFSNTTFKVKAKSETITVFYEAANATGWCRREALKYAVDLHEKHKSSSVLLTIRPYGMYKKIIIAPALC